MLRKINVLLLSWGCKIGSWPSFYLRIPLCAKFKSKTVLDLIIERVSKRLGSWRAPFLSKGGRLTLLKSALVSISNYCLSPFMILVLIVHKIEACLRNFLCNDLDEHMKFHLVDWNVVRFPLKNKGLEFRKLGSIT